MRQVEQDAQHPEDQRQADRDDEQPGAIDQAVNEDDERSGPSRPQLRSGKKGARTGSPAAGSTAATSSLAPGKPALIHSTALHAVGRVDAFGRGSTRHRPGSSGRLDSSHLVRTDGVRLNRLMTAAERHGDGRPKAPPRSLPLHGRRQFLRALGFLPPLAAIAFSTAVFRPSRPCTHAKRRLNRDQVP